MSSEHETRSRKRKHHRLRKVPIVLAFFVVALAIKGYLVLLLWNALIPELFQGPELRFLQAVGLMVLAKLLVGFGGGHFRRFHHHAHRHRFGKHWAHLPEEDREKLRAELRKRWCDHEHE